MMARSKTTSSKTKQDGGYRCLKDNFAYCSSRPDFTDHGRELTVRGKNGKSWLSAGLADATCSRDPKTCRKHRTLSQMVAKTRED